ncbi:gamma-glutamyl hydrolase A-like [Sipha flava]|uniref:folate gamma-glutamyl hydrolase n=1 Tax=Sipha flava TaxID=143950 RepID=A0A8B8FA58_9HEMI|nr:gamma-glutamyl hydrolase A-like [Sipha flava]
MKMNSSICLTFILFLMIKKITSNDKPIIGILTQEIYWSSFRDHLLPYKTYIAASYVKAIESSGGRVVPVFTNRTSKYYMEVASKVNGILVPGGGCSFNMTFGIGGSTNTIFKIAEHMNNIHDHFPVLGVCLGFELLLMASINGKYPFVNCHAYNISLPLELIPNMEEKSVLFQNMPKDIRKILLTEPVTVNSHGKCITPKNFTSMHLNQFWNSITINNVNNLTFISTIEAQRYPFVGLQFHPEKNAFEWERNYPHSLSAIHTVRYFYDWFVDECRKNKHAYTNITALKNELIYNYPSTYVGKFKSTTFEQVYFFNE